MENGWTLVAESRAQAIFIGQVGVYFGIHEIRVLVETQKRKIVARDGRSSWNGRQERHELSGDGINQGGRNDVRATGCIGASRIECIHHSIRTGYRGLAGSGRGHELLAARAVGIAAEGVVDVASGRGHFASLQVFNRAQITRAKGHGGDSNGVWICLVIKDF